ncbi:MAG: site-2 protease family protein [Chitinophagaceae bacterium]|nr:site-2 protease family protein [Chitinophagaceae bacterium]
MEATGPASYPPKPPEPLPKQSQHNILRTIISLLVYIAVYYALFRDLKSVLLLVIVIFLHEMGHFTAMKFFGYSDVKMFFVPLLGAFVSGHHKSVSSAQRTIMIMAGPVPGVMMGLICLWIYSATHSSVFYQFAFLFIFLNVFNLLPVSPLDGGQLLETLFFQSNKRVQNIFVIISCILLSYFAFRTGNYLILIVVLLLLSRLRSFFSDRRLQQALKAKNINLSKTYEQLTDEEYWLIRSEVLNHYGFLKKLNQTAQAEEEQMLVPYVKDVLHSPDSNDIKPAYKLLFLTVWLAAMIVPLLVYMYYSMARHLVD